MADVPVLFDHGVLLRKAVHHAVVLNIGTVADYQAAKVAAQAGIGADIHLFADDHIANQYRRRVHIAAGVYHWRQAINLIHGHSKSSLK
ncbi:hypothetical protein D3C78_1379490 [compost metagenome]